ncbi:MAG: O-antigen ligase family protein [Anaerolineales bacterium]|nr:O-antigen ligase family protein [Anaerolineales bacterium]
MLSKGLFIGGTTVLCFNFVRVFGLSISDWLFFATLVLVFSETLFSNSVEASFWYRNKFIGPAVLVFLGATISLVHSKSIPIAITELVQQIFVVTIFVSLIWILVQRGFSEAIVMALVISGFLASVVGVVDFISGSRIGPIISATPEIQLWGRYAGPLGHPNKFGYFLVLSAILTMAQSFRPDSTLARRILLGCALLVQVIGVFISGSVTAYLGFAFALLGMLIAFGTSRLFATLFWGVTQFLAVIALIWVSWNMFQPPRNFAVGFDLPNLGGSAIQRVQGITADSRLLLIKEAMRQIFPVPFIGAGYDQLSTSGIGSFLREIDGTVHNVFLQILYTGGIFAFVGWVAIHLQVGIYSISILHKDKNRTTSYMVLGLAIAVLSMFVMDQFQDSIYHREKWLVIGLLVGHVWRMPKLNDAKSRLVLPA